MKAYHFTTDKLRNGSPIPPIGEWLEYTGEIKNGKSGLRYAKEPFDALQYAPGSLLHLVEVKGIVETQDNKDVCRKRKILKTIDATDLLRRFACDQALSVYHLWGDKTTDPNGFVKNYLETGDESFRWAANGIAYAMACVAESHQVADDVTNAVWAASFATYPTYLVTEAARATAGDTARKDFNKRVRDAFKGVAK